MPTLPSGTITFLFTDIQGSTALWERNPDAMRAALQAHDRILREAIDAHDGTVFKTIGDAFCAAFETATGALLAAADAQSRLAAHDWDAHDIEPLRVRMALHTGEAQSRDEDYFGPALNKVARLLAVGHGGQTLLSSVTEELVRRSLPEGARLSDEGEHRLRDLGRPQRIFSLRLPGLSHDFPPLLSIDALPNNLPVELSSFIGRERELEEIERLLPESRLLTLTGVGGTGKTRLALQAGADALHRFPEGVWFVPLAEQRADEGVAQAIASALGLREQGDRRLEDILVENLEAKREPILLILDNCEHLIQACAQLCDTLLRGAPQLTVLATSREGLAVAGERILPVPSLALPEERILRPGSSPSDSDETSDDVRLAALLESEALRLFVERAQAAKPAFTLNADNAEAVLEICRRLDGIPLAIELAAARTRALPPAKLAERLDQRFRILTGGSRSALPRQQTLAATIDWSYELLSEEERLVLQRLSVFVGGCTLEAAEAVCAGEPVEDWAVLDHLGSLVDKSLVNVRGDDEHARYHLLETVRQYARDKLVESGETVVYRNQHLGYFAERADGDLHLKSSNNLAAWQPRWRPERENLAAALEWAVGTEQVAVGARIFLATNWIWSAGGQVKVVQSWAERLLAAGEATLGAEEKASLQYSVSFGKRHLGDFDGAITTCRELRSFVARENLPYWSAIAAWLLAQLQLGVGDVEDAARSADEAVDGLRSLPDYVNPLSGSPAVISLQQALQTRAAIATRMLDWPVAERCALEALSIARDRGSSVGEASALSDLAGVYVNQGKCRPAESALRKALDLTSVDENPDQFAYHHLNLAIGLLMLGKLDEASSSARIARNHFADSGYRILEANGITVQGYIAMMAGALDEARAKFLHALDIRRSLGTRDLEPVLGSLGMLALIERDWTRGLRLLGAADDSILHFEGKEIPEGNLWFEQRLADIQAARNALGDAVADAEIDAGRAMTLEEAVQLAMQ